MTRNKSLRKSYAERIWGLPEKQRAAKQLKAVSKKRAANLREYGVLRKDYLLEHECCERCGYNGDLDIHHKAGRNGRLLNDTGKWAALCRLCHSWVHQFPNMARKTGFLE